MTTKKQLAITLSKLKDFSNPKATLEQYTTDSNIAADILWNAHMLNDLTKVADLGAGTGVLGIGVLELEGKVIFVEKDEDAISVLKENLEGYSNYEIVEKDIGLFNKKINTVIMNPPFGVQNRKADKRFVEKAFEIAKTTYYIGKVESKTFIEAISKDHNKKITHYWEYEMPLKKTMQHHTKKVKKIMVGCWRIQC
ncbi:methyltransferase [Candidatus Woesearchaeota archaeon]|jgi:putative methylase|nr:methyltransferase [Candidatus Woesearchaeota archaeon]MBT4368314.1 methyltransferase [Candidatus Woesearchaeota archaeon]MBT4712803.1 methyltransferase [Candidatus Woesearchaeota archaeon]MBT6639715.1 methyltransferase [Candidatus Woesearchaeota archaeon]MBT7133887.1 methyltransferase [Candidatus Woesearchaeota archaeon]